ncbi:hypothetical protein MPSI1_000695 [Malassezia psittaci]|uniref:peptidyl-tRNA hydrolase n=1 Tax=Malassezia psittaci TaxID=1821823 RepID=A0AAF0JCW8_9BASI|nr:hypothetical protein MPSI1_000695 [Malassezia psittaci]
MTSRVGWFAAGILVGVLGFQASRIGWPREQEDLSDSEEEEQESLQDLDELGQDHEECKMRLTPRYVRTWQRLGYVKHTESRQTKIAVKIPDKAQLHELADAAQAQGVAARIIQDA